MALRLKGKAPEHGEVDRRYYMIDVQEGRRRERISSGTRNRALAEKKEQAVLDALRRDIAIPKAELIALVRGDTRAASIANRATSTGPTFGQIGQKVLDEVWSKSADRRKATIVYRSMLDLVGADTPVERIDAAAIKGYIESLKARKNSPATINRKLSCISTVLKRAVADEALRFLPKIPRQSGERRRQFVLDEQQFDALMVAVRDRDERAVGVAGGHPVKKDAADYVRYFAFLYETGMRPGEALPLPWSNIDLERGIIKIRHALHLGLRTKTGKSRDIPMTTRCRELLLEVWGRVRGGPFSNLNHRRANDHWKGARLELGITDKDCVPYATRHSLATRVIEATGDINQAKEWLGHSTIKLTADTYGHVSSKYLARGAAALDARRADSEASSFTRDSDSPDIAYPPRETPTNVN